MEIELRDNQRDHRYEAVVDGAVAGFVQYQQRPDAVVLVHTEVDPDEEGEGIGSALARAVLDDLRGRGLKVVPRCPFIASYIRHHREYEDLVTA